MAVDVVADIVLTDIALVSVVDSFPGMLVVVTVA